MGPRLEPVSDTKYAGMVGCRILWDMGGIKQFSPTVFRVLDEFGAVALVYVGDLTANQGRDEDIRARNREHDIRTGGVGWGLTTTL